MSKIISRSLVAAATASLAIAPIAAQANTRASDSAPVYSTSNANPGIGRADEGESLAGGPGIIIALLAGAAIIAGIVVAADNEDDDVSPGT